MIHKRVIYLQYFMLLSLFSILTGCTMNGPDPLSDREEVRFSAGITTRTTNSGNHWTESDRIGVFMISGGGSLPGDLHPGAENCCHSALPHGTDASQATFSPLSDDHRLYYPSSGSVDFVAYYPHGSVTDCQTSNLDLSDQSDIDKYLATDMLYSRANGVSKSANAVALNFKHVFSRITVNIKAGDGVSSSALASLSADNVAIKGMPATISLNLNSGLADCGTVGDIRPYKGSATDGYDVCFEAHIAPQSGSVGRAISFKVNGETFTWSIPEGDSFEPEYIYNYTLTFRKSGVSQGSYTISKWNGTTDTKPGALYLNRGIWTADDLVAFSSEWNSTGTLPVGDERTAAQNTVIAKWSDNGTATGTICLRTNINMSSVSNFTPIGTKDCPWTGLFYGNGYRIYNLTINHPNRDDIGLFGSIGSSGSTSSIQNLNLVGCNITGGNYVGVIVGRDYGKSLISGCSVILSTVTGARYVGGIVGHANGTIKSCHSYDVTVEALNDFAGGILGYSSNGLLDDCTMNNGSVIAKNKNAGGILGYGHGASVSAAGAVNCHVSGVVNIKANNYVGGVVGNIYSRYFIAGSSVSGVVTIIAVNEGAGGIVGYKTLASTTIGACIVSGGVTIEAGINAGGIVGHSSPISVVGCVSAPKSVTATSDATSDATSAGGVLGSIDLPKAASYKVSNNYWKNYNSLTAVGVDDDEYTYLYLSACAPFDTSFGEVVNPTSFFTSKISSMNSAISNDSNLTRFSSGWRWKVGNVTTNWLPITYKL